MRNQSKMVSAVMPWPQSRVMLLSAAALVLGGCAVGPDFHKPASPQTTNYTLQDSSVIPGTASVPGGTTQQLVSGGDVSGDWWKLFGSQSLDVLVAAALKHNHDFNAAQAALNAMHESVLAQRGMFLPSVYAGFSASRQKASSILAPVPNFPVVPQEFEYSLFTPQLTISYAPDLFGLNRRTQESLQAQENATRFQMIAAWNTLTSNVVVTAVEEASLREQLQATQKLVSLERLKLQLVQLRLRRGDASKVDVAVQRALITQSEASSPALQKQLAATHNSLAVLVGAFPDQAPVENISLADLRLPEKLPVSLPSQLVAQRPDVRQARANLHVASAAIGIAAAERLPNIELSADVGSTALALSRIFTSGTGFWGIAASLTSPIFEGGQLMHQERAAKAAYVEAAQQYRSTVLSAFKSVVDTLVGLKQDARSLQLAVVAERAAHTTLDLSRLQLQHGYISSFQLLNSEQAYQQARIGLIQAEASRFSDTAALYQALGGGWWHHSNLVGR